MNWTFTLLMGCSILTGLLVSRLTQKPLPLTKGQRLAVALGAFLGGMLGAKIPFVLMDLDGLISGAAWFENGKTLMAGLVGGYFGVVVAKWAVDINVNTGDNLAPAVAAAIMVGRLACFSASCCRGTPTSVPWGVDFGDGQCRHPTQLYEATFHLFCLIGLLTLQRFGLFRGQLVKLYMLTYFVYRFLTEFIRPEPRLWLDLTAYQWAALALFPVFVGLWIRDARKMSSQVVGQNFQRA